MYTFAIEFPDKDPEAELVYELVWTEYLATIAPLTILSVVWSVTPIVGDAAPLVILTQSFPGAGDEVTSLLLLIGGSLKSHYRVKAEITLSDGELDIASFGLSIDYT